MKTPAFIAFFALLSISSAHAAAQGALACHDLAQKAINQIAALNDERGNYAQAQIDVAGGDLKLAIFVSPDNKFTATVVDRGRGAGCELTSMGLTTMAYSRSFARSSSKPTDCEDTAREAISLYENLNGKSDDGQQVALSGPEAEDGFYKNAYNWLTPGKKLRIRTFESYQGCRVQEVDYDAYGMHP